MKDRRDDWIEIQKGEREKEDMMAAKGLERYKAEEGLEMKERKIMEKGEGKK